MGDINFSERALRHFDPHDWCKDTAQLTYQGKPLDTIPLWVCLRCEKWSLIPPLLIRGDDLRECKETKR